MTQLYLELSERGFQSGPAQPAPVGDVACGRGAESSEVATDEVDSSGVLVARLSAEPAPCRHIRPALAEPAPVGRRRRIEQVAVCLQACHLTQPCTSPLAA